MKTKNKKYWIRKNDELWGKIVKKRANNRCEICGLSKNVLQAHHWASGRTIKSTRWHLFNGLCLCFRCHFEAHNSPAVFLLKLKNKWGECFYKGCENEIIQLARKLTHYKVADYININIALKATLNNLDKKIESEER